MLIDDWQKCALVAAKLVEANVEAAVDVAANVVVTNIKDDVGAAMNSRAAHRSTAGCCDKLSLSCCWLKLRN